jgi:hypothetical protein
VETQRLQLDQSDKAKQDQIDLQKIQSNEKIANERLMANMQKQGAQNGNQIRQR